MERNASAPSTGGLQLFVLLFVFVIVLYLVGWLSLPHLDPAAVTCIHCSLVTFKTDC